MTGDSGTEGSAAIELVVGVGFLILPAVLLVLSLPGWAQAKTAADLAAREAARTVALALDPEGPAAAGAGREAAATVMANHGQELVGAPDFALQATRATGAAGTVQQTYIEARVTVRMPVLAVPFIGSWANFEWQATHSEPLDIYRSVP